MSLLLLNNNNISQVMKIFSNKVSCDIKYKILVQGIYRFPRLLKNFQSIQILINTLNAAHPNTICVWCNNK